MTNKMKQWSKRFIALLLCFVMTFSNVSYAAVADTTNADSGVSDEVLKAALAEDVELYPDGGFEFFLSQLEGTEGDKKAELVIVRRGGTKQEATVDFKAVGVRNHERSMGYMCVIRAVNTIDAMTATIERIDYDILEKIADRITAEVPSINRVVYEITKKPVATIEFE